MGSLRQVLILALAFTAGLCGGALALNRLITRPFWHPALGRFDAIAADVYALRDRIDVLFVGTSHVMTNVDPRRFDEAAGTFSYNASVEGLRVAERDWLLGKALASGLTKLRYVLVKPDQWLHTDVTNAFSTRARYFDTLEEAVHDGRARLAENKPLVPYRVGTAGMIAFGTLVHHANLGVLAELLLPAKPWHDTAGAGVRHEGGRWTLGETRGFDPLALGDQRNFGGRRLDEPYPVDAGQLDAPSREYSASEIAELARLFAQIRELGAQPVVFVPPVGNDHLVETRDLVAALRAHFTDVPLLALDYSSGHRELYGKLSFWDDWNHLSPEGAALFTSLLAKAFLAATGEAR